MIIEIMDKALYGDKITRGSEFSAGLDLRSKIDVDIVAGGIYKIPLGVKIQCDAGRYVALHMRSGLALKQGLMLVNGTGIIDGDFRGELCAIITGLQDYSITRGERIVQMIEQRYLANVVYGTVDSTERGEGGFGSTGRV